MIDIGGGGEPPRRLPADFDGPVCARCIHARQVFDPKDRRNWRCDGVEPKLITPASVDAVTGEVCKARYRVRDCDDQNRDGDCELFEAGEPVAESPPHDPPPSPGPMGTPGPPPPEQPAGAVATLQAAKLDAVARGPGGWLRRLIRWLST